MKTYHLWTDAEKALLRKLSRVMYDRHIAKELTKLTGKYFTKLSVRKKRQRMGIAKYVGSGDIKEEE